MPNNTKYNVTVAGETVETKSKKSTAVEIADRLFAEDTTRTVQVVTDAGTVVHDLQGRPAGSRTKPWERTEDLGDLELEIPAGYTVAYKRTRVGAVVARANDKSDWAVVTEDGVTKVANTKAAREVTNALAADHKAAVEAKRLADEVAKVEARSKREQERADAKAAKEKEKAEKAAAREVAKAEKEAAKAAAAAEKAATATAA